MKKKKGKKLNLTEKEKQVVHLYLDEHKTYQEIMKIERCAPNFISRALKKHAGEWTDGENEQDENYAEMYRLFSTGKQPIDVAITLNVPVDYVSEQYVEYLKSKKMYRFVQLYERIGDGGVGAVLLGHKSMVEWGFANKPELVGRYLKYCQQMYKEGMNLEEIRASSGRAREHTLAARRELQEVNDEISKARETLDGINKKIEEGNKELARINDAIVYQVKTNPNATAAEAARQMAEATLYDYPELLRLAQEVIYNSAKDNQYTRWLLLPESRPAEFNVLPEAEIERRLSYIITQVALQYYERVTGHIVNRSLRSRNFVIP